MDVIEFVKMIGSSEVSDIKVCKMHGSTHDLTITIRKKIKSSPADAIILAEKMASRWPFCVYKVTDAGKGTRQVEIEYKVKREEMKHFFLQTTDVLCPRSSLFSR